VEYREDDNQCTNDELLHQLDTIASYIQNKKLESPVLFFLQMHIPIASLGSSVMCVLLPFLNIFFTREKLKKLQLVLEDKNYLEYFMNKIEGKRIDT
jgi:hypothetical protein